MKTARQEIILEIIAEKDIETQNQLMMALREHGVRSTQATLSRDIKEMRLVKELAPTGRYRYTAGSRTSPRTRRASAHHIQGERCELRDRAELIVIKTLPGLAMAASSALDGMSIQGLVGTVAGDDTAFLAMCDAKTAEALCAKIKELF
jgi:transcriptional regulator of arginine metabolism